MTGPDNESLTAALRRLADEHATGLLSVATPGREVILELAAGVPVAVGPVSDVSARVGDDAWEGLTAAAVVDELVDRIVASVVGGHVEWAWDVSSSTERLPVPRGLIQELARRAVDAAQALATVSSDDVLEPAHAVATSGELDWVRGRFDGTRTVEEVAAAVDMTVPTVATMAAALVAGGALTSANDDAEDEVVSWTDAVAEVDTDDADDEPELWVMDPPEDETPDEPAADEQAAPTRTLRVADSPAVGDATGSGDTAPAGTPAAATEDAISTPAAADDAWNDTTWLDELPSNGEDPTDARAALTSMLSDLQHDQPARPAPTPEPDGAADEADGEAMAELEPERRAPKAEPGDVADFLRELSRLALDDD